MTERLQQWLVFLAAVLFLIGALGGGLVSLAMTGQIAFDPGSALAAHLNALLGALWMICVAWTLPRCRLDPRALKTLVVLVVLANYANWAITTLKAGWQVKGLAFVGNTKNDLILGMLLLVVVLPTLSASGLWAWGLRPGGGKNPEPVKPTDV